MINTKKNVKDITKRLENLKNATMVNYLEDIDLDNEMSLYDVMFHNFVNGNLYDYFSPSVFDGMKKKSQKKLHDLTHNYVSLCFAGGNTSNWSSSVETVEDDYDFIALKILDNYNFLLSVAKSGGKRSLEQLKEFKNCEGYNENATIDYLRNTFLTDAILKQLIVSMSKKDSFYNIFTDKQKASLCRFPEGTLYFFDDANVTVKLTSPLLLALEISRRITGESYDEEHFTSESLFAELATTLRKTELFDDIILEMNAEYMLSIDKTPKDMVEFMRSMDSSSKNNRLDVDNFIFSGSESSSEIRKVK